MAGTERFGFEFYGIDNVTPTVDKVKQGVSGLNTQQKELQTQTDRNSQSTQNWAQKLNLVSTRFLAATIGIGALISKIREFIKVSIEAAQSSDRFKESLKVSNETIEIHNQKWTMLKENIGKTIIEMRAASIEFFNHQTELEKLNFQIGKQNEALRNNIGSFRDLRQEIQDNIAVLQVKNETDQQLLQLEQTRLHQIDAIVEKMTAEGVALEEINALKQILIKLTYEEIAATQADTAAKKQNTEAVAENIQTRAINPQTRTTRAGGNIDFTRGPQFSGNASGGQIITPKQNKVVQKTK